MNYITSDLHFYHENVIRYCNRPFGYREHMHERLIAEINNLPNNSTLYSLGDFIHSSRPSLLKHIMSKFKPSIKFVFIPGNHDHRLENTFKQYGEVHRILERNFHNTKVVMCHFPMYEWNRAQHGAIHFHGHCHARFQIPGRALDVGWDYKQRILTMDEAMMEAAAKPIWQPCHDKNNGIIIPVHIPNKDKDNEENETPSSETS